MVAGLFDEVVEACTFASKDEDTVGFEVEVGVVGGAALVEAEDPDVLLFELFEGADEVGDAGDANVLGCAGGGFGYGGGDGCGTALGDDDAVDTCAVGGAKEGAEVVGIFDAVEGEEEVMFAIGFGTHEVFDAEELALFDDGEDALMGVGPGEAGELVAGFDGDADAGSATELDEGVEPVVAALTCYADVVQMTCAGSDCLLHWMKAVKNFHAPSLPLEAAAGRR